MSGADAAAADENFPPLNVSYDEKERSLLDAYDNLRRLKVTKEGVDIPALVVVGDDSSGKSSVLEALCGVLLPRGPDIRAPLILKLRRHEDLVPKFHVEYRETTRKSLQQSEICDVIRTAMVEISGGSAANIASEPVTLEVFRQGVPDLTLIRLPKLRHDDVVSSTIVEEYIKPKHNMFLNILAASSPDFATCQSTSMLLQVDSSATDRTLAIITKSDESDVSLTLNVANIESIAGQGFNLLRNRINQESFNLARGEEKSLFDKTHRLRMLDNSSLGIHNLANKLLQIQSASLSSCLPNIRKKIQHKLLAAITELDELPVLCQNPIQLMSKFIHITRSYIQELKNILIDGEYDDEDWHTRLESIMKRYFEILDKSCMFPEKDFLMEEINAIMESKGTWQPDFFDCPAFLKLLRRRLNDCSIMFGEFAKEVDKYFKDFYGKVLVKFCEDHPQLLDCMKRATEKVMEQVKIKFLARVTETMEVEVITYFPEGPNSEILYEKLMGSWDVFFKRLGKREKYKFESYGTVETWHLGKHGEKVNKAFQLRMRLTVYWNTVLKRLRDFLALQMRYFIHNALENQLETEILKEVMGTEGAIEKIEKMMRGPESLLKKREELEMKVGMLKESENIIDEAKGLVN